MKRLMFVFAAIMFTAFSCWANSIYDDLVKLVKAGVDEEVVIAYINGLNGSFSLSPDNIVQLKPLGASDKIITAAIQHKEPAAQSGAASDSEPAPSTSAPAYAPAPQQAPAPAVVYETAPPAGGWVWMDDCWYWQYPTGVIVDLGWYPSYHYHNHWIVRGGYRGGYYGGYHGGYHGGNRGGYHGGHRGRR